MMGSKAEKKRWVAAALLGIGALLAGCAFQEEGLQESRADETENTVIKWMIPGEKYQETDRVLEEFNDRLQERFPGTTVEFEIVPFHNYKDKWEMKMATNEEVDVAWISGDYMNFTGEVKKGSLMAIDYLLSSSGQELRQMVPEDLWKRETFDGNIYGVPVLGIQYREVPALAADRYYMERYGNLEEIVAVNQENPYTNAECFAVFEPFLEKVHAAGDIGKGVSCETFSQLADKGYEGIYGAASPFVIKIFDGKLRVYNKYELESYQSYYAAMADWYQKGYIREDIADVINPAQEDGKEKGSILFLGEYQDEGVGIYGMDTEYESVSAPLQKYKYVNYGACRNSIVIPKSAENPVRAMEILNYLLTEEGKELYRLLVNGMEKEHYLVLEDDTIVRRKDNFDTPLYAILPYAIGNVFNDYESRKGEFAVILEGNSSAVQSPLTGFELDTRMIAVELEAVDLVVDAYRDALSQGIHENWQEVYQDFIEDMREAGSDKVLQEMQKQMDDFQEKKRL